MSSKTIQRNFHALESYDNIPNENRLVKGDLWLVMSQNKNTLGY